MSEGGGSDQRSSVPWSDPFRCSGLEKGTRRVRRLYALVGVGAREVSLFLEQLSLQLLNGSSRGTVYSHRGRRGSWSCGATVVQEMDTTHVTVLPIGHINQGHDHLTEAHEGAIDAAGLLKEKTCRSG
ncbi:hypothetical protein F7725_008031 [Dissostichus mawsoni]|uniref:Uncharacterized protein n=1 Tax=Dissostichus mawsoni TaxID=36200 RepID=A0A7J5Y932_DISMA|nr:hypothetical protein F7725_008031 [Dissostichus mawsoni]